LPPRTLPWLTATGIVGAGIGAAARAKARTAAGGCRRWVQDFL